MYWWTFVSIKPKSKHDLNPLPTELRAHKLNLRLFPQQWDFLFERALKMCEYMA